MVGHGLLRDWESDDSRVVKQRTKRDCAICCIAMATGKTYEEIVRLARHYYQPDIGTFNAYKAALLCGLKTQRIAKPRKGIPGLLTYLVKIVNNQPYGHMVYWDGERTWDPASNPQKGRVILRYLEITS